MYPGGNRYGGRGRMGRRDMGSPYPSIRRAEGSNRLYVGNLSWNTSWQDLKDHMRQAGEVLRADVPLDVSGRSKGYGLVEYATAAEAKRAVDLLTDSDLDGRNIQIREDREAGPPARGAGYGGGYQNNYPSRGGGGGGGYGAKVFVGNLSWQTSWQNLKDHMRQCGEVLRADLFTDETGRSKGSGMVEYSSPREAAAAMNMLNNSELDGRMINVREDREAGRDYRGGGGGGGYNMGGYAGGFGGFRDGGMGPPRAGPLPRAGPPPRRGGGNARIYVGNLPWSTSWQDLKDFCRLSGNVLHADVMMGPDGRSKGFGLVEYASPAEASRAIQELDGQMLGDRQVLVHEDRDVAPGPGGPRGGGGGSRGGGSLFVGNIAWSTSWQDLKDHFRQCGEVGFVDIPVDGQGRSKGFALVRYDNPADAANAIDQLSGTDLDGRQIEVREDHNA